MSMTEIHFTWQFNTHMHTHIYNWKKIFTTMCTTFAICRIHCDSCFITLYKIWLRPTNSLQDPTLDRKQLWTPTPSSLCEQLGLHRDDHSSRAWPGPHLLLICAFLWLTFPSC
jgi:hypothetical protein